MKKINLLLLLPLMFACESVSRLHYGIKYDGCSSVLDISRLDIVYGKFNLCGPCCDIVDFPTTPVVKSFQIKESETSEPNTHFTIPLGTSVVEFDYNVEFQIMSEDDAKKCFMACKNGKDFDNYVRNNMKNNMRSVFQEVIRKYKTPEDLLNNDQDFQRKSFDTLRSVLLQDGITLHRGNMINMYRFPTEIKESLDRIQAVKTSTMEQEAENKSRVKNAEAAALASKIESESNLITTKNNLKLDIAKAEADKQLAIIEAERDAAVIRKITASLTPSYLRYLEINKFTYRTNIVTPNGQVINIAETDPE